MTAARHAPAICDSDDLTALELAADELRTQRAAAEAAIEAANTDMNWPFYDRACAEFDRLDDELFKVDRRIEEVEDELAFEARREERRAYWSAIL